LLIKGGACPAFLFGDNSLRKGGMSSRKVRAKLQDLGCANRHTCIGTPVVDIDPDRAPDGDPTLTSSPKKMASKWPGFWKASPLTCTHGLRGCPRSPPRGRFGRTGTPVRKVQNGFGSSPHHPAPLPSPAPVRVSKRSESCFRNMSKIHQPAFLSDLRTVQSRLRPAPSTPAREFQPTGNARLRSPEVNPVLRVMRQNGIEVMAVHHMLDDEPRLYSCIFCANDDAQKPRSLTAIIANST
jgi:hypothetical protein